MFRSGFDSPWLHQFVMKSLINACLVLLLSTATLFPVILEWDPSPDTWVSGYNIYYSTSSVSNDVYLSNFTNMAKVDAGASTNCTITNLTIGSTYYFVATSYASNGLESLPSNEIFYSVPDDNTNQSSELPSAVQNFRMISPPTPIQTPKPILHYSFESIVDNTVIDSSGNGCDGVIYGNPSLVQRSGGNALNISSIDQYIVGKKINVTTNGTLSIWFMATNAVNNDMICGNGNWQTDRNGFILAEYNTRPYFELNDSLGKNQYSPTLSLSDGNWKMWTFTWNGTNISCFTNGVYWGQVAQTKTPLTDVYEFSVATDGSRVYRLHSGNIDEVRVYDRALTETEIQDLYQTTK